MCVIGCQPFRAGNNFFGNIDKGIKESEKQYGIKMKMINVPQNLLENDEIAKEKYFELVKNSIEKCNPKGYFYQGIMILVSHPDPDSMDKQAYGRKLTKVFQKKNYTPRYLIKFVKGDSKVQLIPAYSKETNIKSYLRGDDHWRPFPHWFIRKKLSFYDPKSFDDSLEIIQAKSLDDVKGITEIMKKGKSPCIFCSKILHKKARGHFNSIFPEYTWCVS